MAYLTEVASAERLLLRAISYWRLVRDDEQHIDVPENMIYLAMCSRLLHRLHFRQVINCL